MRVSVLLIALLYFMDGNLGRSSGLTAQVNSLSFLVCPSSSPPPHCSCLVAFLSTSSQAFIVLSKLSLRFIYTHLLCFVDFFFPFQFPLCNFFFLSWFTVRVVFFISSACFFFFYCFSLCLRRLYSFVVSSFHFLPLITLCCNVFFFLLLFPPLTSFSEFQVKGFYMLFFCVVCVCFFLSFNFFRLMFCYGLLFTLLFLI